MRGFCRLPARATSNSSASIPISTSSAASRDWCAGAIAARYAELGGEVRYHGKPHASIYAMARDMLAPIDDARILCVGDGLRTDILGATKAGLDCAFIPGGVHGIEMGIEMGGVPAPDALARVLSTFNLKPTYVLPELRW